MHSHPDPLLPINLSPLIARTDIYKGSFFPQTIRDWNAFSSDSIISFAEGADDGVARFTSLMIAKDLDPIY